MTWFLLSWMVVSVVICYWVYGATMKGSHLEDEQFALRTRILA